MKQSLDVPVIQGFVLSSVLTTLIMVGMINVVKTELRTKPCTTKEVHFKYMKVDQFFLLTHMVIY